MGQAGDKANLGNLSPAVSSVAHLLEAELLLGRPRRVCATLLGRGLRRGRTRHVTDGGGLGRCRLGLRGRGLRHGVLRGAGLGSSGSLRRGLAVDGGTGRRGTAGDGRLGGRSGAALTLARPGRLGGRLRGRGLLRRRAGGLGGHVHGRLNGSRVMLLLRRHVGLWCRRVELHALVPAVGHVGLVGVLMSV